MVSVAGKDTTIRVARARVQLRTIAHAIDQLQMNGLKKGDALATARIAGIMAAKQTSNLIPLCHNVVLTKVAVNLKVNPCQSLIDIESTVECEGGTGVEMEALTACSIAALSLYDMLKAIDKHMTICDLRVVEKRGGKADWNLEQCT